MHTTKSGLVDEALDLDAPAADAVRFVPVDFRSPNRAVRELDRRFAFELPPATFAILFLQFLKPANLTARGDELDPRDRANDLEATGTLFYALVDR